MGRAKICLSLNCKNLEEVKSELNEYLNYSDMVEFCADKFENILSLSDSEILKLLSDVKKLVNDKPFIVDYKGEFRQQERIITLSSKIADICDVDYCDSNRDCLITICHNNGSKVLLSNHYFDRMPSRDEISETYLLMEKTKADILKIAAFSNTISEANEILCGLVKYKMLENTKPCVGIAMGEMGKQTRICAGDFGSVITYACGTKVTAPGQIDAKSLFNYMNEYYE